MDYTRLTNLQVDGDLKIGTGSGAVNIADGAVDGRLDGTVAGTVKSYYQKSTATDLSLSGVNKFYFGITLTAASKTVTGDFRTGQIAIIANEGGTNAFTFKNVSGDTGTSIAAGKVALVVASTTANATKVFILN